MNLKLVLISPTGTLVENGQLSMALVTQLCGAIERLGTAGVRFAIWSNKRWTQKGGTTTLQEYVFRTSQVRRRVCRSRAGTTHPARRRGGSVWGDPERSWREY